MKLIQLVWIIITSNSVWESACTECKKVFLDGAGGADQLSSWNSNIWQKWCCRKGCKLESKIRNQCWLWELVGNIPPDLNICFMQVWGTMKPLESELHWSISFFWLLVHCDTLGIQLFFHEWCLLPSLHCAKYFAGGLQSNCTNFRNLLATSRSKAVLQHRWIHLLAMN